MNYLLIIHIISAIALTVSSVGLIAYAYQKLQSKTTQSIASGSFLATLASGAGLLFFPSVSITHFCVTMTAFSLFSGAAHIYYNKRTATKTVPVKTDIL